MRENEGRGPLRPGSVLELREPTSAHRPHAERLKRAVGDDERAYSLRLTEASQRRGILTPQTDAGQRPVLIPVREIQRRIGTEIIYIHAWSGMPDPHELVRVRIWQRLDQHRVDDAEDRGGRADAERERQHRSKRECGPSRQAAQRVAQIATHRIQRSDHVHATAPMDTRH